MNEQIEDSIQASAKAEQKKRTRGKWTMPTEVDFSSKMLNSIRGKKYESYAISRIVHLLDDPEIELVTQKPIRLADNSLALLDLFLPQFDIGVEVDELHHLAEGTRAYDQAREQAVIVSSDIHPLVHLSVESTDPLSTLKEKTDELIARIREWKAEAVDAGTFIPFSYGDRYSPEYWRERGVITIDDDIQMPRMRQVLALFGKNVEHWQMGTYALRKNFQVWMPGLHQDNTPNRPDWKNVLGPDGLTITQTQLIDGEFGHNQDMRSIVFARFKDPVFLDTYYRFLGVFRVDSIDETGRIVTLQREDTQIDLSPYL